MRRVLLMAFLTALCAADVRAAQGIAATFGVAEGGDSVAGLRWSKTNPSTGWGFLTGLEGVEGDRAELALSAAVTRKWCPDPRWRTYLGLGILAASIETTTTLTATSTRLVEGRGYGHESGLTTTVEDDDTDLGALLLGGVEYVPRGTPKVRPFLELRASTLDALETSVVAGVNFLP